jgi:predicted transcriptional regulator
MAQDVKIGRAELEVLHYVHEHHPVTVRQVADAVGSARGVVRTTVLNVMNRLVSKGYLVRHKEGGVWQYGPRTGRKRLLRSLVRDFVDKALRGSIAPFVAYLAEDARLSDEELAELRQIVGSMEASRGDKP